MRSSKILAKVRAGKHALMVNVSMSLPYVVEIAGRAGIDGVWLDMEHRPFGQGDVAALCAAGRLGDIDPVVRVRKGEGYSAFFRPLEDGAAGIIVPHVVTREEAEWIARNAKFPPEGRRGLETVMPDADMSFADPLEYMAHANGETFVCIQIEDVEALDHLDEIISVKGIDLIFIGPADLTASMGIPFQLDHAKFQDAVKAIAAAVARHGKWWGLPVRDFDTAQKYSALGARFLNMGSDFSLVRAGFLNVRETFDRTFD